MVVWNPPRETVRIRNGKVVSVSGGNATVTLDGAHNITGVPVYGPLPAAGAGVLVLEQGGSLLVLGNAVSLLAEVEELRSKVAAMEARLRDG